MKGCGDALPSHAEERFLIQGQYLIDSILALHGTQDATDQLKPL
jgi:hypothetical protein